MEHPPQPREDGRQSPTARTVQRGVLRHLAARGVVGVTEFSLVSGRRADILALDGKGEISIIEIKSSVQDFRTDGKWPEYRAFCDRLLFAVPLDFPTEILPGEAGLLVADAFGAELLREAPRHPLPAATRKALTLRLARTAANRLAALYDPDLMRLDI
ncbi:MULTISPECIES: MmcB family DNA repair protein [unclassified Xanthobacter]|uniref:MmcB family DNA repair protein n=1 Tax=unclassified Xanthobacter TaxID=2623496 RepID=UPI001F282CE4|nr:MULTISPECIES: MmcB family DNA repair protein [unclassified Xanthobacter]